MASYAYRLSLLACALALLGAGCSFGTQPQASSSSTNGSVSSVNQERLQLETVLKQALSALNTPNGKGYGTFLDATVHPETASLINAPLDAGTITEIKKTFLYDPSRITFLEVQRRGDWAGYFFLVNPADVRSPKPNTQTVGMYRFHLENGTWKLVPEGFQFSTDPSTDPAEKQRLVRSKIDTLAEYQILSDGDASDQKQVYMKSDIR